jgi:hypothetical protein
MSSFPKAHHTPKPVRSAQIPGSSWSLQSRGRQWLSEIEAAAASIDAIATREACSKRHVHMTISLGTSSRQPSKVDCRMESGSPVCPTRRSHGRVSIGCWDWRSDRLRRTSTSLGRSVRLLSAEEESSAFPALPSAAEDGQSLRTSTVRFSNSTHHSLPSRPQRSLTG